VGYEIAAKAYGRRRPQVVVDLDSNIPSERMLAGPTDFSGRDAGGRAACRASAGPVPPRRVPAADAFTFTVALALVAFCMVPVLWLPRTKAPTEQAKTPALIG